MGLEEILAASSHELSAKFATIRSAIDHNLSRGESAEEIVRAFLDACTGSSPYRRSWGVLRYLPLSCKAISLAQGNCQRHLILPLTCEK